MRILDRDAQIASLKADTLRADLVALAETPKASGFRAGARRKGQPPREGARPCAWSRRLLRSGKTLALSGKSFLSCRALPREVGFAKKDEPF
jgi:hypothetical protein